MSDVLNGLGTTALYKLEHNWKVEPQSEFRNSLKFNEFSGTIQSLDIYSEDSPRKLNLTGSCYNKVEEKEVIEFVEDVKGRYKRFWIRSPLDEFTLLGSYSISDTYVSCSLNDYEYKGYERIYIEMKNGDIVTGEIDSITESTNLEINLKNAIGYTFTSSDVVRCSLLLLCRLDIDGIIFKYFSDLHLDFNIELFELIAEDI